MSDSEEELFLPKNWKTKKWARLAKTASREIPIRESTEEELRILGPGHRAAVNGLLSPELQRTELTQHRRTRQENQAKGRGGGSKKATYNKEHGWPFARTEGEVEPRKAALEDCNDTRQHDIPWGSCTQRGSTRKPRSYRPWCQVLLYNSGYKLRCNSLRPELYHLNKTRNTRVLRWCVRHNRNQSKCGWSRSPRMKWFLPDPNDAHIHCWRGERLPGAGASPCVLCYHYRQNILVPFISSSCSFNSLRPYLWVPLSPALCAPLYCLSSLLILPYFISFLIRGAAENERILRTVSLALLPWHESKMRGCNDFMKPQHPKQTIQILAYLSSLSEKLQLWLNYGWIQLSGWIQLLWLECGWNGFNRISQLWPFAWRHRYSNYIKRRSRCAARLFSLLPVCSQTNNYKLFSCTIPFDSFKGFLSLQNSSIPLLTFLADTLVITFFCHSLITVQEGWQLLDCSLQTILED